MIHIMSKEADKTLCIYVCIYLNICEHIYLT